MIILPEGTPKALATALIEGYIVLIPVSLSKTYIGTLGLPAPSARLRPLPPIAFLLPILVANIMALVSSLYLRPKGEPAVNKILYSGFNKSK